LLVAVPAVANQVLVQILDWVQEEVQAVLYIPVHFQLHQEQAIL
jgi:hypothetical protein